MVVLPAGMTKQPVVATPPTTHGAVARAALLGSQVTRQQIRVHSHDVSSRSDVATRADTAVRWNAQHAGHAARRGHHWRRVEHRSGSGLEPLPDSRNP